MSVERVRGEVRRGFQTGEHVSKTALKRENLHDRLGKASKLLIMDHSEPDAIMLTLDMWNALREWDEYTQELERLLDEIEDEALNLRYADRVDRSRRPMWEAVPEAIALLRDRMSD